MKIRYCALMMLILLLVGYFISSVYLYDDDYITINMNDINDRYSEVINRLDNCSDLSENELIDIGLRYNCVVVMRSNPRYETIVNNAIADQKVLLDYMIDGDLSGKIIFAGQAEKLNDLYDAISKRLILFFISVAVIVFGTFTWIFIEYIRPFKILQKFATQISKGNLDFPLKMTRHNYFGAFTESFDIMRVELKKARQGEYEANKSKKELVASLSHDIKTPVATIKAICEILMIKAKDDIILEKVIVINQKAGIIDSLISNMFHATLEELNLLKVIPIDIKSTDIPELFKESNYDNKIGFTNSIPECLVIADKLRLNQVIDNILNNSYKYAATNIEVSFTDNKDNVAITIRDFGPGVLNDDLPLLTEKFYRGKNVSGKDGSGLGLYLSKQFMNGMNGNFTCKNIDSGAGFMVILTLLKV